MKPIAFDVGVRRSVSRFAFAVAAVAALGLALHLSGVLSRRVLPGHRVEQIGSGAEALAAWLRAGVRGRVLVWYDRSIPLETVPEETAQAFLRDPTAAVEGIEDRFVYLAMRANVIRRVVFVVPDDRWDGYARAASGRPDLRRFGEGFVHVMEGMPVISMPARARGSVIEGPPLIYMSAETRKVFGDAFADRLLEIGDGADLVLVRP